MSKQVTEDNHVDQDYYQLLGVRRDADNGTIRTAYRRLARKVHPDIDGGDEESFKETDKAYKTLIDPTRRRAYDISIGIVAPSELPVLSTVDALDMAAFAGIQFRRMVLPFDPPRGADRHVVAHTDIGTVVAGGTMQVALSRRRSCGKCHGSGDRSGRRSLCQQCGGAGSELMRGISLYGQRESERLCGGCSGYTTCVLHPCPTCGGEGRVATKEQISVPIPYGWNGERVRVAGEGDSGLMGGAAGDLYVKVVIRPHPVFMRRGYDLLINWPDPLRPGDELTIPLLTPSGLGSVCHIVTDIEIVQHSIELSGQGMPYRQPMAPGTWGWQRGALYVLLPRQRWVKPVIASPGPSDEQLQATAGVGGPAPLLSAGAAVARWVATKISALMREFIP